MLEHGGRLGRAAREYGIPREQWLDLSTGVSPFAYPVPVVPATAWHRLPEDDDGLIEAARSYYGAEHLLPVSGSQAAIAALPRLRERSRVAIIEPAYAEHAHAWRQAGHDVVTLPLRELLARASEFDVIIIIRPNNPTGERPDRETLLALHASIAATDATDLAETNVATDPAGTNAATGPARTNAVGARPARDIFSRESSGPAAHGLKTCRAQGALLRGCPWLIVDEAFIDANPEQSLCGESRDGLIVLRSVGKFFGLAGARAGFVAAWPALLNALAETLGPWTLTGPSRYVVAQALADRAWHASARAWLQDASTQLAELLTRHGMPPSGACEFFQYCVRPDATELHHALAQRAVLVRQFDAPQALRFGLPGHDAAFAKLDGVLTEVLA